MENKDQGAPSAESAAPPLCSCGADMVWAECHLIDCEDGWYDEHDYDAVNYGPGSLMRCGECHGEGGYWVCEDRERHSRAGPRAAAPEALSVEDAAGITDVIRGAAQGEEK